MIRYFLLLLSLLISGQMVFSQTFTGKIKYRVTENLFKQRSSLKTPIQTGTIVVVSYGGSYSFSSVTSGLIMDLYVTPTQSFYKQSEDKDQTNSNVSPDKEPYFMFRDFAAGKQSFYLNLKGKMFLVEDSLTLQQWKIHNDIKEVAGHLCMSAQREDTVRNQKITAWFALDITLSTGPEVFCGLPGLILEANVNDGAYIITAQKIERMDPTAKMALPEKLKGKKITKMQYVQMNRDLLLKSKKEKVNPYQQIRYLE
jgi:GLPGLI family protein